MTSTATSTPNITELEGTSFREYDIQKVLGRGGMAIVYQAFDRRLESLVAIKFLLPEYSRQDHVRKRFLEEARLQFKLRHPGLVRVTSLIEEGSIAGVVMDLVEGRDLAKLLREEKVSFSLGEIQEIFLQVLDAVGYAHSKKVVHRDLKPSNILVEKRNGRWRPYVMDFGIAKSLEESGEQTKTGSFLGSPNYCSPEQIKGDKTLDHRSDIYALGCTLYEILAGSSPFGFKESLHQVLCAHLMEPPPSLAAVLPAVAKPLDRLLADALEKDRDKRYPTCEAFAQRISQTFAQIQASMPSQQKALPKESATFSYVSSSHAAQILSPPPSAAPGASPPVYSLSTYEVTQGSEFSFTGLRSHIEPPVLSPPSVSFNDSLLSADTNPNPEPYRNPLLSSRPSVLLSLAFFAVAFLFLSAGILLFLAGFSPPETLLRPLCQRGYLGDCFRLAWHLEHSSPREARLFYHRACSQKNRAACYRLSLLYLNGKGGESDPVQAKNFREAACRLGAAYACFEQCLSASSLKPFSPPVSTDRTRLQAGGGS